MQDSNIANNGGTGRVDPQKMKKLMDQELTRGMSPRHREAIENYFRNIAGAAQR
jgi:hypothetical protein